MTYEKRNGVLDLEYSLEAIAKPFATSILLKLLVKSTYVDEESTSPHKNIAAMVKLLLLLQP